MVIDEKLKVDTSRPPEQSSPNPNESTTTIDAEPAAPTEAEEDLSEEQQGMRKHLIALSIVLCQLVVVCDRLGIYTQSCHLDSRNNIGSSFRIRLVDLIYSSPEVGI